jgi:putative endonuclease
VKFYTYILKSSSSGKLYIGQTNNLSERLSLHNSNQVLSTKNKGPWELIFYEEFSNRSDAMKLETKLKKWKNRDRIIRWIEIQTSV